MKLFSNKIEQVKIWDIKFLFMSEFSPVGPSVMRMNAGEIGRLLIPNQQCYTARLPNKEYRTQKKKERTII